MRWAILIVVLLAGCSDKTWVCTATPTTVLPLEPLHIDGAFERVAEVAVDGWDIFPDDVIGPPREFDVHGEIQRVSWAPIPGLRLDAWYPEGSVVYYPELQSRYTVDATWSGDGPPPDLVPFAYAFVANTTMDAAPGTGPWREGIDNSTTATIQVAAPADRVRVFFDELARTGPGIVHSTGTHIVRHDGWEIWKSVAMRRVTPDDLGWTLQVDSADFVFFELRGRNDTATEATARPIWQAIVQRYGWPQEDADQPFLDAHVSGAHAGSEDCRWAEKPEHTWTFDA